MASLHAVYFSPDAQQPPAHVREWLEARALPVVVCTSRDDLMARALRGRPPFVIFDARTIVPETLVPKKAAVACTKSLPRLDAIAVVR